MGIDKRFDELDIVDVVDELEVAGSNTFYPDQTELDEPSPRSRSTAERIASMGLSGNLKVIKPEK